MRFQSGYNSVYHGPGWSEFTVWFEAIEIESGTNTVPNAKIETKASATIARENLEFLIQQTPFFLQAFLHAGGRLEMMFPC